jgi:release factor glutamine methyltransferase
VTVLEAIQRSSDFFAKKGVESPRLQAELLLADVLRLPRMQLYIQFERALSDAETAALRDRVVRRGNREPLQHILGTTSFCGLEIRVTRDALVPRPETEILAEKAWTFLRARTGPTRFLDFGTGTGCIAIAVANQAEDATGIALDISESALALARENAAKLSLGSRITFVQSDGFGAMPAETFDLIISNPPYIAAAEITTLEPEVRDHDPRLALDGGADGLDFYRRLATESSAFLKEDGVLMAEFGDGQAPAIQEIFERQSWRVSAIEPDDTRRLRYVTCRRGGPSQRVAPNLPSIL